jgi:mitogen-activated protein kinase kinase kinase
LTPSQPFFTEETASVSSEEDDTVEVDARFEWQHMLSNVLQGDVLKSEKTRISTASLTTTSLMNNFELDSGGGSKRQRAYAIWLKVRARVRGRSPEEEGRYIEEARAKVDDVLEEVVKFRVVDLKMYGGVPVEEAVRQKNAADQVAGLLKRVDWCESLYPSTKALALEKPRVNEIQVVSKLEALRSWQQITRRLEVTIGILKKWTGSDWEALSGPQGKREEPRPALAFVEVIVREDSLQATFQKQLLSDLYSLVNVAKTAMIDLNPDFLAMNLPGFTADLSSLAVFPSRLAQEALRTRLESVANINDPSIVLIDQLTADLRKGLATACEIKRQYQDIAEPDPVSGWSLPLRVMEYEETLLSALRYFFKLLHWKLKSPSKAIYFKETEIVENEWGFLSVVTEQIEGGDLLVGEHFR